MFNAYREVLTVPGAARFSATGLLARLPIAMLGIGIVLLVSEVTGAYTLAGALSAAFVFAGAAFAVVHGRLIDGFGQARVLPAAITLHSVALVLLMTAVQQEWPLAVAFAAAIVSGGALPQVGACVRARWAHVLAGQPRAVQTAYAFEAVADEVIFITGPVLVTVLATSVHPLAGLSAALVAGLIGTLLFSAQRATAPPARRHAAADAVRPTLPWGVLAPLGLVMLGLGAFFGAVEVATVAHATDMGHRAASGPLLAIYAVGSLVAGVVAGAIHWRRGPEVRLAWGAAVMALTMVVPPFVADLWVLGWVLLFAGLAISPTLIATMSLTERVVPSSRLTEGMATIHTGLAAGIALGSAATGWAADLADGSTSYWVAAASGVIAAVAAQLTWWRVRVGDYRTEAGAPADARPGIIGGDGPLA